MGIFNFFKNQFIEIIEWIDDTNDTIIYKFPDEDREIKMGAQLVVRESQVALFLNEGKIADVYGPGRHELSTRNMPILSSLKGWKYGFNSPFKCDVYFVSTKQMEIKWGTKQPILIRDPEFDAVRIRAFGNLYFKVVDARKFFTEVAGTDSKVTTDEVLDRFRSIIISKFTSSIGKTGKSILDLASMGADLGAELLPFINNELANVGLEVKSFNVESINLPEELQAELDEMVKGNMRLRTKRKEKMLENEMELTNLANKINLSQNVDDMTKFLQMQTGLGMTKENTGSSNNLMNSMIEMSLGMNMVNQMMNQQKNNIPSNNTSNPDQEREKIMATLKQLGELKEMGVLTQEEFDAKKKELLSKLV
jgi:membrane protease subunit (stomatin/prohibitin family)